MLKSPMIIISNPVVCTFDNSTSNRSIQLDEAFCGRYKEHEGNDFEFVKDILAQRVSNFVISSSSLR